MPVPKRKRSKSRRDKRFANKGIKARAFGSCQNCTETVEPHAVCKSCGFYRGRKVLTTKSERSQKRGEERKERENKLAARAPEQGDTPIDTEPEK